MPSGRPPRVPPHQLGSNGSSIRRALRRLGDLSTQLSSASKGMQHLHSTRVYHLTDLGPSRRHERFDWNPNAGGCHLLHLQHGPNPRVLRQKESLGPHGAVLSTIARTYPAPGDSDAPWTRRAVDLLGSGIPGSLAGAGCTGGQNYHCSYAVDTDWGFGCRAPGESFGTVSLPG